jgi:hypothetical protein
MNVIGKCLKQATSLGVVATMVILSGCNALGTMGNSGKTAPTPPGQVTTAGSANPNYQPVSDIPIPPSTKINTERSVILGSSDRWFGRMVLVLDRPSTMAYAYYLEQMPPFGWELVSAVQGKVSTLTFTRGERAATVEITPSALRGSEATVTVSPRPTTPPAAPTVNPNSGAAAPKK